MWDGKERIYLPEGHFFWRNGKKKKEVPIFPHSDVQIEDEDGVLRRYTVKKINHGSEQTPWVYFDLAEFPGGLLSYGDSDEKPGFVIHVKPLCNVMWRKNTQKSIQQYLTSIKKARIFNFQHSCDTLEKFSDGKPVKLELVITTWILLYSTITDELMLLCQDTDTKEKLDTVSSKLYRFNKHMQRSQLPWPLLCEYALAVYDLACCIDTKLPQTGRQVQTQLCDALGRDPTELSRTKRLQLEPCHNSPLDNLCMRKKETTLSQVVPGSRRWILNEVICR